MITLPSYKILDWPFKEYEFISNLIEYDGPLLVHYMKDNKHALFYWVDGDREFNRWLCFEITISDFYDYLHKDISLHGLIYKKKNEPFFITDIDSELNYGNFQMLHGYAIPDGYIPDIESFYLLDISPQYEEIFANEERG